MAKINRRAILAKTETVSNGKLATEPPIFTLDNLIPITDISNTPLQANRVEQPRITGHFGAPKTAIANRTQALSITCPVLGNWNEATSQLGMTPLNPLILACGHTELNLGKDLTSNAPNAEGTAARLYKPTDKIGLAQTVSVLYVLDDIIQIMRGARGTLSFNFTVGEFPTMTFELQSDFKAPEAGALPSSGTRPDFNESLVVSGKDTFSVPGLPAEFENCVSSFSFTQGATVESKDCGTREGMRPISYDQTGRSSSGEIVADAGEATVKQLFDKAASGEGLSAPVAVANEKPSGLIRYQSENISFVFGAENVELGEPSEGSANGDANYTVPLTFRPKSSETDYRFGWLKNDLA